MSTSLARLVANRANSRKSTGPRTVEGKRRASANSMKHGLYCSAVVMPGESERAYELVRQRLIHDYKPQNGAELFLVERIAVAHWKLLRLLRAEEQYYEGEREAACQKAEEVLEQGKPAMQDAEIIDLCSQVGNTSELNGMITLNGLEKDLDRLSRMEQRLENSIHRWTRELERLRKLSEKSKDLPRSAYDYLEETMESVAQEEAERDEREANLQNEANASHDANLQNEANAAQANAPVGRDDNPAATRYGGITIPSYEAESAEDCFDAGSDSESTSNVQNEASASRDANLQNEANAAQVQDAEADEPDITAPKKSAAWRYQPIRLDRWEEEEEVEKIDPMERQRRIYASWAADILGVKESFFDGMSEPYIAREIKARLKKPEGEAG